MPPPMRAARSQIRREDPRWMMIASGNSVNRLADMLLIASGASGPMLLRERLGDVAGELAQKLAHRRGFAAAAGSLGGGLQGDVPAQQQLAAIAIEQRPAACEHHLAAGIGAELSEGNDNL